MIFKERLVKFGFHGNKETPCRIVKFLFIESEKIVKCSATLIYSEYWQDQIGYLFSWSLSVVGSQRLSVPVDTVSPLRGAGIGTYLRDRVVARVKHKFSGYSVVPAKLSVQDSDPENFERRHRFYCSAGFTVEYSEGSNGAGRIFANDVDELIETREEGEYEHLELPKLLKELYAENQELKRKSENFDEYYDSTQRRIDALYIKILHQKILCTILVILAIVLLFVT